MQVEDLVNERAGLQNELFIEYNAYTRLSGGTIGGVINEVMDVKPTVVGTEEPVVAEIPAPVVKQ